MPRCLDKDRLKGVKANAIIRAMAARVHVVVAAPVLSQAPVHILLGQCVSEGAGKRTGREGARE